jgi:hypothetical protein
MSVRELEGMKMWGNETVMKGVVQDPRRIQSQRAETVVKMRA